LRLAAPPNLALHFASTTRTMIPAAQHAASFSGSTRLCPPQHHASVFPSTQPLRAHYHQTASHNSAHTPLLHLLRPAPMHHHLPAASSRFATSAAVARGTTAADTSPQGPGMAAAPLAAGPSPALLLVQQAGIQIPQYCCGCGVKLQQVEPENSG